VKVRDATEADLPAMLDIYNDIVINSSANFDLQPSSLEKRRQWFNKHGGRYPLIIAEAPQGKIAGYCCISPFREKDGYLKTVELSVYVDRESRRRGVATLLMREILDRAKELEYHSVVSCIAGSNEPSVKLHDSLGFQYMGRLKQVGFKFSRWEDDVYYQLVLD
jgi:L-amino acid N-acyltransferase